MRGVVDDHLRALVPVQVSGTPDGAGTEILAWIDTAFNGGLTIPARLAAQLSLVKKSSADAVMADGRTVTLETFECTIDWFGRRYRTQAIGNDGEYPLLGAMLLADRRLVIDYRSKSVELD